MYPNRLTVLTGISIVLTVAIAALAIAKQSSAQEGIAGEAMASCAPNDAPTIQVTALDASRNEQIRIETVNRSTAEPDEVPISAPGSIGGTTVTLCDKTAGLCRYASTGYVSIKRHENKAFEVSYQLTTLDGVSRHGLILAQLISTEPKMCG